MLLKVFQRLVDAGHSVLVIEHNLDVIKSADWVIDLGPGSRRPGRANRCPGHPEEIAACQASHTGQACVRYCRSRGARYESVAREGRLMLRTMC